MSRFERKLQRAQQQAKEHKRTQEEVERKRVESRTKYVFISRPSGIPWVKTPTLFVIAKIVKIKNAPEPRLFFREVPVAKDKPDQNAFYWQIWGASNERIEGAIKQVGHYIESGELDSEDGRSLLDLLYAEIGRRIA